jgi:predicted enzyme related to lactoylglutathione lyase
VADVDVIATAIVASDGRITMEKSAIPTVGEVIYFEDPEGNRVGAMEYVTPPR